MPDRIGVVESHGSGVREPTPRARAARTSTASARPVFLNSRFQFRRATGVDVHAAEVVARLADVERIAPPRRCVGGLLGHLWEQTALPARAAGGVLWSPCNTGPVLAGRHVLTLHDVAPFDVGGHYSGKYQAMALTTMVAASRRATAVATVSQFSADRIADRLGVAPDRIHVVGNGIRGRFLDVPPVAVNERSGEAAVVTLGSFDPRKRLADLVEAHERSIPGVPLQVIGGRNDRVFASHASVSGRRVEMLGYLPTDDVVRRVSSATAFVSFSAYEGFGLPPVEAAAMEVPVIVSDIPAHREVLGGLRGVHFAADADELAELLRAAVEGELARPDRSEVVGRHDWGAVADRYVALFDLIDGDGDGVSRERRPTARRG